MRAMLTVFSVLALGLGVAVAHEGKIVNLKAVPPDHQVEAGGYCRGRYEVKLKDGSTRQIAEFDLRFKTDSSPNGPRPGAPVLVPAGMAGDRAFVIFADPDEMKAFLKKTC